MNIVFLIWIFLVGAIAGSFLCCRARRLKMADEKKNEKRSVCLKCGCKIKWYDNLPILSWIFLGGKCRECHAKIGWAEFLSEIGMGLVFLAIGWKFYGDFGIMIIGLLLFLVLGFLAIHDGLYGELPVMWLTISIIFGIIFLILKQWSLFLSLDWGTLIDALIGVAILAGTYFLLYILSHEKMVGGGDWMLALSIAFLLGDWRLAIWEMFISNFLGFVLMLPMAVKNKRHKFAFGPFLVVGAAVVIVLDEFLLGVFGI